MPDSQTSLKLWLQMVRSTKMLEREANAMMRDTYGQSLTRFDVMSQLFRAKDQCLTVGKLASQLIASNGNITGLIDRMEKEGLVAREYNESDRRSIEIRLTVKGTDLFEQMAEHHAEWISERLSAVPKKSQSALLEQLHDLYEASNDR